METIKRQCNVVMLSTNEKARIGEITSNLTMPDLFIMNDRVFKAWNTPYHNNTIDSSHLIGNNLYFTSNEEIGEGDYCINDLSELSRVVQVKSLNSGHTIFTVDITEGYAQISNLKKIIASTDPSLGLPQPSIAFINKYITEYNNGNVIEKVVVDYFCDYDEHYGGYYADTLRPKVSKDNTIIISKVKDSWSKEELPVDAMITLVNSLDTPVFRKRLGVESIPFEAVLILKDWINKNL